MKKFNILLLSLSFPCTELYVVVDCMYKTGKKTQTDNFLPSSELPQQPVSWCKVEVGIFLFSIWTILFFHYFVFIKCNIIITILQAVVTKPDHVEVASEQSPPPPMVRL